MKMEVMTCKKFNELQIQKWHRAVIWQRNHSQSYLLPVSTYGIRNKNGELRNSGFVLLGADGYSWFKTKKEIKDILKLFEDNA